MQQEETNSQTFRLNCLLHSTTSLAFLAFLATLMFALGTMTHAQNDSTSINWPMATLICLAIFFVTSLVSLCVLSCVATRQ